jgi:hypothetical protein
MLHSFVNACQLSLNKHEMMYLHVESSGGAGLCAQIVYALDLLAKSNGRGSKYVSMTYLRALARATERFRSSS